MTSLEFPDLRPDIAASWRRADLAGVDHAATFDQLPGREVDPRTSLLVGAAPVLHELEEGLVGTGYSTLLGDRDCRVVRRWFDDPRTREGFDALNIVEGVSLLETDFGTNGLGTVFETRKPLVIHGSEHFVESLRQFSCYGHPIRHPLTRRIEGILDISAIVHTANPLLQPLIARAVHDIEQRLLDGSRVSEKCLLAAFQEASGHSKRAVLAIGEDIVMTNRAASDVLSPADIALLRVLAEEPLHRSETQIRLTLTSAMSATVTVTRVPGARRGVLLEVDVSVPGVHLTPTTLPAALPSHASAPTLVSGPPGTGRTTLARTLAQPPMKLLRAATALLEGEATWAHDFEEAMLRTSGTVLIDGIDLLADELLDLVIESVDARSRPRLILTSGPVATLTGRAATLAATATVRRELLPLSARRSEIPGLAASMLRAMAQSDTVHLTPGAIHALTAHSWPGNLRELKAVVAHCARRRSTGGIVASDLPEEFRLVGELRPMAALEQAERDVIVGALREAGGNKVQAARALGVSRTTLYARIRHLRIASW